MAGALTSSRVMSAAREAGIKVPSQLSVIGVDDMPLSSYFDPPLTTMRQDIPRIGREAARMLLEIVQHKTTQTCDMKLPAELVIRQSTSRKGGD